MTDNIFEQADQVVQQTAEAVIQQQPTTPVIPPELQEYVGEGKKYKSVDEVYKAFPNAQKHIQTLEEENRQIKEELSKRKAAEEILNDIQNGLGQQQGITPPVSQPNTQDISQIVRQELERKQQEDFYRQNQTVIVNEFKKHYGDKAQEVFEKLAIDNGVPITTLNQLAATSPNAIYKLAGISPMKATQSGSIQSDINTQTTFKKEEQKKFTVPLNGGAKQDAQTIAAIREKILAQQ